MTRFGPIAMFCTVIVLAGSVVISAPAAHAASTALDTPKYLQVESVTNPLGVDVAAPRMSWRVAPLAPGAGQQASEVQVARTSANLTAGTSLVLDTTTSGAASEITYAGTALAGNQRFYWHVRVQDSTGAWTAWSATNFWQMGLLVDSNWQGAQWIGSTATVGAPQFRNDFTLPTNGSTISWASVTVAGLGLHVVRLNGAPVDNHQLDPSFTNYSKRLLYVTHNIVPSQLVAAGNNTLGFVLGSGWYDPDQNDSWNTAGANWSAGHELVRALLTVRYADGSTSFVKTDANGGWTTSLSETTKDSPYMGEDVDLTKVQAGWDSPGFTPTPAWATASAATPPPGAVLDAQIMPAMTKDNPVSIVGAPTTPANSPGTYDYQVATSTAGWAQIRMTGTRGQVVTVKYSDMLDANGTIDFGVKVNYGRWQEDRFTLTGNADVLEPRFTYKGFTYVQISAATPALTSAPSVSSITVYPVHTALPVTGSFTSSDATLNTLHAMDVRTLANSTQGLPTDGPAREKMGWLADAQLASENGLANFDIVSTYEKFLTDMRDAQQTNGLLPDLVPSAGFGNDGRRFDTWWTGSLMGIAWNLYRFRGDVKALRDSYSAMAALMAYMNTLAPTNLMPGASDTSHGPFGDHASPGTDNFTDLSFMQTTGYLECAKLMTSIAHVLGRATDESSYATKASNIIAALNSTWYDSTTNTYKPDNVLIGSGGVYTTDSSGNYVRTKTTQASLALAIVLGMVPTAGKATVANQLVSRIQADGKTFGTGIIGTKYLFKALDSIGRDDLAYSLVTASNNSYAEMIANGATAMKESWTDSALPTFPALTSVEGWMYDAVSGIHTDSYDPTAAVTVAPNPVGSMTSAGANERHGSGTLQTQWSLSGTSFTLTVTVPVGMTVSVSLPHALAATVTEDGAPVVASQSGTRAVVTGVGSGTHVFTSTYV